MRRVNYDEMQISLLKYLYNHRSDNGISHRIQSRMVKNFNISIHTVCNILFELKGMGNVDRHEVGNMTVWTITEKGKEYLNEEKVLSDDDE